MSRYLILANIYRAKDGFDIRVIIDWVKHT